MIKAGETAPDFELSASDGNSYRLANVLTGYRALLIFYPANDTPG